MSRRIASRHHPLLVALHWLLALLILGALALGLFGVALVPDADPHKIDRLEWHMAGGMLILLLMAIRLIVRLLTARPAEASSGHPLLDRLAPVSHYGFYVLVLLTVGAGYATAILAGLPAIVFARSGSPLPASFAVYPTFVAHAALAALLTALIALHLAAALYHQYGVKDDLLRRMTFGGRTSGPD